MRSRWILLAPLAAPLFFLTPAEAQIGPACCVSAGETHPADRDPEEDLRPFLVPAEVRRPDERALEATAEAPVPVEVPVVNAIGIPLEERPGVSEPTFVPAPVVIAEPLPAPVDGVVPAGPDRLISVPPCCQVVGETHVPDAREPEESPPILVGAKVKNRDERALKAAAELPIPAQAPRVDAVSIPLEERPGVSEPEFVPASANNRPANIELIGALFIILLAIAFFWLSRRRRSPQLESEPAAVPVGRPPLPDELTRLVKRPVPLLEPVTAATVELVRARELEPA